MHSYRILSTSVPKTCAMSLGLQGHTHSSRDSRQYRTALNKNMVFSNPLRAYVVSRPRKQQLTSCLSALTNFFGTVPTGVLICEFRSACHERCNVNHGRSVHLVLRQWNPLRLTCTASGGMFLSPSSGRRVRRAKYRRGHHRSLMPACMRQITNYGCHHNRGQHSGNTDRN